jgi:nitrous-oxide reductase
MKLLLDFPTVGEPHYGQAVEASLIKDKSVKFFKIEENQNPYVAKGEGAAKVTRNGNRIDVYLTQIRSHFVPDNIEGIKMGDEVYWHVTNLEQDWDVPHGFAVKGANNAELLVMPGVRVSPANSNVALTFSTGKNMPDTATAPPLLEN